MTFRALFASACLWLWAGLGFPPAAAAEGGQIRGRVSDETGGTLPGVTVELRAPAGSPAITVTGSSGEYAFDNIPPGRCDLSFSLLSFASSTRRGVEVGAGVTNVDVVLHLALNADVTVTGKRTFANLADVESPAENLVGIAQSASQGAVTARQLDERPLMRGGEVLESVPGVIVTQHSGEGKANQYFLRGFNLDHGTDFAATVAGMPVNMPTHAHGQGYSDLSFLIPELVTGVQFSKGPYYADQGDFATAGASTISYANMLERPIVHVDGGGQGYSRVLLAASPGVGAGHLMAALEVGHNDGPWNRPDDYQKLNAVVRYSQGNSVNGLSLTGMAYHGRWNSTDQIPSRAVSSGLIDRFGALDPTDGGHTYRYSVSGEWQHGTASTLTKVTAYGIAYDLGLFSNFTYYLNDPVHGDQIEQADHRLISGLKASHRRLMRWGSHAVQNTVGVQIRNDDITTVGLYHTQARVRLDARRQDAVLETSGGVYAQSEIEWAPKLRSLAGIRADAVRFDVAALERGGNPRPVREERGGNPRPVMLDAVNSGTARSGLVSPKGGVTVGPWGGTEIYINAGAGFHSNDARGATVTRDPAGLPVGRVTPLVRAKGAEIGIRTVAVPHLQSTLSIWTLRLGSELVFSGDDGTTVPSRPSERHGVEWANYYRPIHWLMLDGDVAWSRARFTEAASASTSTGLLVPEAVGAVVSAGITVDGSERRSFGSLRWRYFGPRALIEDASVRSRATSLVNLQAGYRLARNVRAAVDVFNLLNAKDSEIDYFYASRLPGEPLDGVRDIHLHPTIPRTARVSLVVGF